MDINLVLTTDSLIALLGIVVTILIATIGGIYAVTTNTKKYELTENYRKELLTWYTSVVNLMIRIIHLSESGVFSSAEFANQKTELLSQLSALTEVGRFYFPNVDKGDHFGKQKPSAYQGYRHITLEFLMHFYHIALSDNTGSQTVLLWRLERHFTSGIFDMVEPSKRNREYSRYLALTLPEGETIGDFLTETPKNIRLSFRIIMKSESMCYQYSFYIPISAKYYPEFVAISGFLYHCFSLSLPFRRHSVFVSRNSKCSVRFFSPNNRASLILTFLYPKPMN